MKEHKKCGGTLKPVLTEVIGADEDLYICDDCKQSVRVSDPCKCCQKESSDPPENLLVE